MAASPSSPGAAAPLLRSPVQNPAPAPVAEADVPDTEPAAPEPVAVPTPVRQLAAGLVIDTMVPEAVAETHDWAGVFAVLGFLISFSLSELAG